MSCSGRADRQPIRLAEWRMRVRRPPRQQRSSATVPTELGPRRQEDHAGPTWYSSQARSASSVLIFSISSWLRPTFVISRSTNQPGFPGKLGGAAFAAGTSVPRMTRQNVASSTWSCSRRIRTKRSGPISSFGWRETFVRRGRPDGWGFSYRSWSPPRTRPRARFWTGCQPSSSRYRFRSPNVANGYRIPASATRGWFACGGANRSAIRSSSLEVRIRR